ncbi:MAG: hypothetical protein CVV25_02965 [Ignavibacteriae bacterium HGW-Ignavibacteriae-4]|jgi:flagellar basal body-associated protein FliL|nr:MAG: hypothetical protein CVV25_02965 [Ignavibacteriae bacterium HGW-Ignavibacteriae-4]
MADDLETQDVKDEKTKKDKKGSPLKMILLVVGILVVNAIIVIGVVKFFFADAGHDEHPKEAKTEDKAHNEKDEFAEFKNPEESFFETENQRKMLSTGRITTNPANSIKKFVIINLGLEYRIKPDLPEEEFDLEKPLMLKLMIRLKAKITDRLGSMRVEELVRQRSELTKLFKEDLQEIFNENQMFLREVYLNEFLIQ